MLTLVLDSSGSFCGVGVYEDDRPLCRIVEPMQRGQDARLMPMVTQSMARALCDFPDLDRIAVTRGPGSFTGVRVGIAAARGIGMAARKPVVGIDRFSIYKRLFGETGKNLLVVIESKRAELFCKFYPASGEAHEACMMTEEEIARFVTKHPGTEIFGDIAAPEADTLGGCAGLAMTAELGNPDFLPRPLYLRAPDVTMAKACG